MNEQVERILVLSPYTSDGVISAGGSISRLIEEGKQVFYTAFCINNINNPHVSSKYLSEECLRSLYEIGIPEKNIRLYNFKPRLLYRLRQDILDIMISIGKELRPNLIICPSSFDTNQDHHIIYEESFRAYKKTSSIWGMDQPWSNLYSRTDIFLELNEKHIRRKIESLMKYKYQYKEIFKDDFVRACAYTKGMTINVKLAEAFECIRIIV